jgi:hypothetical protein
MRYAVTLVFVLAGCAAPRTAEVAPPASLLNGPERARAFVDSYYVEHVALAAEAAGLVPLAEAALPPGTREARVWVSYAYFYPRYLYRVVEEDGASSGEVVLYWEIDEEVGADEADRSHADYVYFHSGRCGAFTRTPGFGTCRGLFARPPDWRGVLGRAGEAGLWTLPGNDPPEVDFVMLDGWGFAVELRDGPAYRAYSYGNPDAYQGWAEGAAAVAVVDAVRALDSLLAQPDIRRVYRGATTGRYGAAFYPCGSAEVRELNGDLRGVTEHDPPYEVVRTDTAVHFAEVLGELSREGYGRTDDEGRPFDRLLYLREARAFRPWTAGACDEAAEE